MCCCILPIVAECTIYPTWVPTDFMFTTHADGDQPKWKIYADSVRKMICEESGLKENNQSFQELKQYWKYMIGKEKSYLLPTSEETGPLLSNKKSL